MTRRGMPLIRGDVILLAVNNICREGAVSADFPALVLAAWGLAKARFGLRGWEMAYPCSQTVRTALVDGSGPIKRGLVEYAGVGKVRLTEAGRRRVAELLPILAEAS